MENAEVMSKKSKSAAPAKDYTHIKFYNANV